MEGADKEIEAVGFALSALPLYSVYFGMLPHMYFTLLYILYTDV